MRQTQHVSIGEKWQRIADETRNKAHTMPPCEKRDELLKKARQLDVAITLNNSLSVEPKIPK